MNENYTYILRCADGTYYCGWTNNLDRRLKAHNEGSIESEELTLDIRTES